MMLDSNIRLTNSIFIITVLFFIYIVVVVCVLQKIMVRKMAKIKIVE